jgi:hypothetical protein
LQWLIFVVVEQVGCFEICHENLLAMAEIKKPDVVSVGLFQITYSNRAV